MKVSLIQISSDENKEDNVRKAKTFVADAAAQGADIVCLPECFLYHGEEREKKIEVLPSPYLVEFQEIARTKRVNIILGSIILREQVSEKPYNVSFIIDRHGEVLHRYRKQYLYDVERSNFSYHESDTVKPGSEIGIFEMDGVTMGIGICVDLRYPEYFRELTKQGAEIIFLPSSFRVATGERAWDILTKARAIENQLFFCACGQSGGEATKARVGNSRIISYDGSILSEMGQGEGIVSTDIDVNNLREFRKEFPVLNQMR